MNSFIQVQNAEMVFSTRKGRFHALREIDLDVAKGEFVTLIGHSGCGKSTLLNLIAGLLLPTSGVLLCDNREIASPGPERAVVFQNHSLLPWPHWFQNLNPAVECVFGASESRTALKQRTDAALELVGMAHASAKRPHEISGGMKQRVGIGFWVWDEWNNLNVKHILIAIVVIGVVGLLLEALLISIAKRFSYDEHH